MNTYEDWEDWREKKHRKEDRQLMLTFLAALVLFCADMWLAFSLIGFNCETTAATLGRM